MKKLYFFLTVAILSILFCQNAFASHVAGGQITYKYISTTGTNHTYEVEIVVFGDCSGGAFGTFTSTTAASLSVYNGTTNFLNVNLPRIYPESDILISPVCPTAINQTTCTSGGTLVGIKKFTFRANVVLNGTSANWRFVFTGNLVGGSSAGRSNIADNVVNPAGSTFHIAATLNNTLVQNSSPTFTSDPTPFYCLNVPSSFGLGAVDIDGDNLEYSLVEAINNPLGTATLGYNPGYSPTAPLNTVPGSFNFSPTSGVAEFIPNAAPWEGIVVSQVTEKRNGQVIGTSAREMMFVFLPVCNNTAPTTPIGNVGNGEMLLSSTANNVIFTACEAQYVSFIFDISAVDPQGDNVTVSSNNLPAGATLDVQNNGTPNPQVHFNWNLATVPAGTYQFFITFKDDGCPLASVKTVSYTVLVQPFSGNFTTGHQQPCRDMSNGFAFINPSPTDTALYKYTWMDPAFNILQTMPDRQNFGDTLNNILPGAYIVDAENYRGCKKRYIVIVDSPTYKAQFKADSIVCIGQQVNFDPAFTNDDFVAWNWDFGNGTTSNSQTPLLAYPISGQYTIKLKATTDIGCVDSFEQVVTVDSIMGPEFTLDRESICVGEKVNITTDYGYNPTIVNWTFGDGGVLQTSDLPNLSYAYPTPGIYNIDMKVAYRSCPEVIYSKTIVVNDKPKVYLGPDTGLCYQGAPVLLANLNSPLASDRYRWNTGDTTASIFAKQPGIYSVTVTRNDCSTTDSVNVRKDCYIDIPNAFIPGTGDATGYFLPRSILSRGVQKFDMTIYNRWGEKVFFTNKTDGRGWDGAFNGQDQPMGVYVYQINVTYLNGAEEKYQGNVTLVR